VRRAIRLPAEAFIMVTPDGGEPASCGDHDDDVLLAPVVATSCRAPDLAK
jgi:hypothetical protein